MHERTKKYEEISGFINEVIWPRVIVPFFPAGSFYSTLTTIIRLGILRLQLSWCGLDLDWLGQAH